MAKENRIFLSLSPWIQPFLCSFLKIGQEYPEKELQSWMAQGYARLEGENLMLVNEGKLIADRLSSDIFVV